ncbi:hypothetical protein KY290_036386 [Solanum tuberosum]|uniref:Transposon MuDR mudrA n=1 Tax=Solanum tuberosum TaxID=4113 RepID=A0ABQ7TSJ0_SOLTU|nr:hypothetical protein KY289_035900 [Solanum tuberosum]KAH0639083.1 hypothetical protein KY285_035669 [Solanum tuberosum]KAH0737681.1 hypothetical protein KY290_036386 [Solanum tuberosum]
MDIIIVTRFHHGGKFVEGTSSGGLTYIGKSEVDYVDPTTNNFVLVDNDFSLLKLIKDLGDGDFLDLYIQHVVDEVEIIKDGVPTGYLCGPTVGENVNEDGVENSHNINVDEGAQSENINVEVGVDDASDLEGVETYWDISDDSHEFAIPDDDDSKIDEEGFEDIGRNKAARYVGRLEGDEQYINSSELDSDDSRDELDHEVVEGGQQVGRGRGREGASTSTGGNKRPKTVGFGIYTDDISGRQTLNPGLAGERVVTPAVFKCATPTNIDIGYKPRGLK